MTVPGWPRSGRWPMHGTSWPVRISMPARRSIPSREISRRAFRGELERVEGDLLEPGLGAQGARVVVLAQQPEQTAHLRQRVTADLLDGEDRLPRAIGLGPEQPPSAARVHDHHADVVGDDVLQFEPRFRGLVYISPIIER